jgi:hypothetical protein
METGELLTRWSVRASMALYVVSLALRLTARDHCRRLDVSRWAWAAGFLAFALHVVFAFHFVHGWRHRHAYETTAQRTAEVIGVAWGGGLYANYLFALVWAADVVWRSLSRKSYEARSRNTEWLVQGFLGFIAFNGAVVFGAGAVRWGGLAASIMLGALLIRRYRPPQPDSPRRADP